MSTEPTVTNPSLKSWSAEPLTAWILIAIVIPIGGWLFWEIHQTVGLNSPRFWELLQRDRVFDVVMLDFFLTSGWAGLVLLERAKRRDWRTWAALSLFCIAPSLGIAVLILVSSTRDSALTTHR